MLHFIGILSLFEIPIYFESTMQHFISLLFIFTPLLINAQSINTDSLWNIWKDKTVSDDARFNALYQLIWHNYLPSQPDSAFHYTQILKEEASVKKNKKWKARAFSAQGIYYAKKSNFGEAIKSFEQLLQMKEHCNGNTYLNIGECYLRLSNYVIALEYFQKAQRLLAECGDESHKHIDFHIASVLNASGAYQKAELNFLKVAEYFKKSNDKRLTHVYRGLGEVKMNQKEYQSAFEYFTNALDIAVQYQDRYEQANISYFLGQLFYKEGKWEEAHQYFQTGLKIYQKLDNKKGLAAGEIHLGNIALYNLESQQAIKHCSKGLELAKTIAIKKEEKEACECLYKAYQQIGDSKKAFQYYKLFKIAQDSLFSTEQAKKITALQLKYKHQQEKKQLENEKKALANRYRITGLILLLLSVLTIGGGIIYAQKHKLGVVYKTLAQKSKEIVYQKKLLEITTDALKKATYTTNKEDILKDKLLTALKEEQLYLDSTITLTKLATLLDTNTSYLSRTINSLFNKNFNTLINEYRIKQVIKDIEANVHETFTIETLAKNAGFKSRSAFNRAFKKYIGLSPSAYISAIHQEKD